MYNKVSRNSRTLHSGPPCLQPPPCPHPHAGYHWLHSPCWNPHLCGYSATNLAKHLFLPSGFYAIAPSTSAKMPVRLPILSYRCVFGLHCPIFCHGQVRSYTESSHHWHFSHMLNMFLSFFYLFFLFFNVDIIAGVSPFPPFALPHFLADFRNYFPYFLSVSFNHLNILLYFHSCFIARILQYF